MLKTNSIFILLIAMFLLFFYSCSKGLSSSSYVPEIDFEVPGNLIAENSFSVNDVYLNGNVMQQLSFRADRIVSQVNRFISQLNNFVNSNGEFYVPLSSGDLSGYINEISDDDYDFEAVVCLDGLPFHYIKWNSRKNMIYSYYDHSYDPVRHGQGADLRSIIKYSSSATKIISINVYGTPWNILDDIRSNPQGGEFLGEYLYLSMNSDRDFVIKGVDAWEVSEREISDFDTPFSGDVYLSGRSFNNSGSEYLSYRIFNQYCNAAFDDLNIASPGWCFNGNISSDGVLTYSGSTDLVWANMSSSVGIADDSDIVYIEKLSLSCSPDVDSVTGVR